MHRELLNDAVSVLFKWVAYLDRYLVNICKMSSKRCAGTEEGIRNKESSAQVLTTIFQVYD